MSARRRTALALLAAGAAAALAARQPGSEPGIDTLFPWRAQVTVPEGGPPAALARLRLPGEVLAAARSDLSDLRLLDGEGREVPFVLDRDAGLRQPVASVERVAAEVLGASQERVIRDETVVRFRESYLLSPPPEGWAGSPAVDLLVESPRPRFVKELRVERADGTGPTPLEHASLFRLPDPLRERVRFALTGVAEPLRVTLEGEDGAWLEPTFAWEHATGLAEAPADGTVDLPLEVASRSVGDGITRWRVVRPRGAVPLALVLDTSTPLFRRVVTVRDEGPGVRRRTLLTGEVWRVGAGEERLVLPWPAASAPVGAQLEIAIEDGDSPPLADLGVALRLARPALLFAADPGPRTLVWGGGLARPPRYDVGSLIPDLPAAGAAAARGRPLLDESGLLDAALGPAETNPRFDPASPLDFAMAPGREVDRRRFTHRRALTAPPSATGLYRYRLAAADQAVLRADLGDLRVVDDQDRQRPYVLVSDAGRDRFAVSFETGPGRRSEAGGETLIRLELPAVPLAPSALVLEVDDDFFDRPYTVEATPAEGGDPVVLARGRLRRERGERSAIALELTARRVRTLAVRIADGSDRPLRVTGVEVETPAPEVLFPAEPGAYVALLGDPDARPPRYDLETVRGLVQTVESAAVEPGPLEPNEALGLAARLGRGGALERIFLGAALAVAVIVLTALTLRLASPAAPERTLEHSDQPPLREGSTDELTDRATERSTDDPP